MFFVRFIQQVLHSLRDSDAMIRKTRSFPTFHWSTVSLTQSLMAFVEPVSSQRRTNVQIEPLLFHFLRTSFIVHALLKCFERSSFKKTRCLRARSKKSKRKGTLFVLVSFAICGFQVFFAEGPSALDSYQHRTTNNTKLYNSLSEGWKSDCSPWATESNWQLLNQSCDDIVMKWMKKNSNRDFSHHAREATPEKIMKKHFFPFKFFSALTFCFSSTEHGFGFHFRARVKERSSNNNRNRERRKRTAAVESHIAREGV